MDDRETVSRPSGGHNLKEQAKTSSPTSSLHELIIAKLKIHEVKRSKSTERDWRCEA